MSQIAGSGEKQKELIPRLSMTFDKGKIHRWCREGKYSEIVDLISEGVKLQSHLKYGTGVFGYTPLHEACAAGHSQITKLLLKEGADPNVRCSNKYTPLHLATIQRHPGCVEVLVKFGGAKMNVEDKYNRTPLNLAIERKSTRIINLLMGEQMHRACKDSETEEINKVLLNASKYKPNPILPEDYEQCLLSCIDSCKILHMRKILLFSPAHHYTQLIERADMRGNMEMVAYLFLCSAAEENKINLIRFILNMNEGKSIYCEKTNRNSTITNSFLSEDEEKLLMKSLPQLTTNLDRIIPLMLARKKKNSAAVLELLLNIDCNKKTKKIGWQGLKLQEIEDNVLQKVVWVEELDLGNNQLKRLNENICVCLNLAKLDLSKNRLEYFDPLLFRSLTNLEELDVSDNLLTSLRPVVASNTLKKFNLSANKILSLPDGLVLPNIQHLSLSHNKLNRLPYCVTNMTTLEVLDISHNMGLFTLPLALGKLEKLIILRLDGLPELNTADFPKTAYDTNSKKIVSSALIQHYKHKYQNSCEFNKLKIYVVGKQNRGKSTLVRRIKESKEDINISTVGIEMNEWTYPSGFSKKSINYILWDFGGQEEYYAAHQCFLSQGSMYLLVWNITHGEIGIQELIPWLDNIKARTPKSTLIIVATHLDMMADFEEVGRLLDLLSEEVHQYRGLRVEKIMCVSCLSGKSSYISELREAIHQTALKIKSQTSQSEENVFGTKVPQYYLTLDKKITALNKDLRKQKKSPILTLKDFKKIVESWNISDLVGKSEIVKAINFLHKAGKLLYYNDPNSGLNELVFVNPQWLCNMMANIITIQNKNPFISNGLMEVRHFHSLFKGQGNDFPPEYFKCYLHLLEKFEIGMNIGNSVLLIPSLLPSERPTGNMFDPLTLQPFYARVVLGVDMVPYGFWSRLLSRLLHCISELREHISFIKKGVADEFERDGWCNIEMIPPGSQKGNTNHITTMITGPQEPQSINNPVVLQVWRQGIFFDDGVSSFLVESLKNSDLVQSQKQGVLIICSKRVESCSKFGQIYDTILDLCASWYPGVHLDTYLLSEEVVHMKMDLDDEETTLPSIRSWFENPNRPLVIASKEHKIEDLAPDLLLLDLPSQFVLKKENFEFDVNKTLGKGGYGSVFVGSHKGKSVAIKTYHQTRNDPDSQNEAFCELRRESMVLKSLHHPCLIGFEGILMKPHMSLVLEIAPMGSLSDLINKSSHEGKPPFVRQIYYRIAKQVASGLNFLHCRSHPIIFRDLKPSNVLVISIDPLERIQVKLTDFGIAAYLQPSGHVGLEGTKGFQAPEILKYGGRVYYDHRVDIFSYGMLLYNVVSMNLPYASISTLLIDQQIINKLRPSLSNEVLNYGLCLFEDVIRLSWDDDPRVRPNASSIIELVSQPTFQSVMCIERVKGCWDVVYVWYGEDTILTVLRGNNGENRIELRCKINLTVTAMIEYKHEVHAAALINEHVWSINRRVEYGDFFAAVWELRNGEYIIAHKELFPVTCSSPQLIEHDKYVYAASRDGVIFRLVKNNDAIQRGELEMHLIYTRASPLDTLMIVNDQYWCSNEFDVFVYDQFSIETKINYPLPRKGSHFRYMTLACYRDEVWISHLDQPLLSVFNTEIRKWKMDIDLNRAINQVSNVNGGTESCDITSICSELDTVWIGLSNGTIVIMSATQKIFLITLTPYKGSVLHLLPMLGSGATGSEKASILSYGHGYTYERSVSNSLNKEHRKDTKERENAIILWECQSSEEFKAMKAMSESKVM